ncbi:hypothetical protein [Desulfosarcina sp.]|uniref:hypothetical protein n=1 Tax=Desulfosarcina sp. TaxID=2027861 RepID=UPI0039706725
MLQASYEFWGVSMVALLIGMFTLKRLIYRRHADRVNCVGRLVSEDAQSDHDIQHRALMFLMAQKTDTILAALARTITQERQKLGTIVRNPSIAEAVDAYPAEAISGADDRQTPYDRILPMAQNGIAVERIARQLQLPEAEVSLVMRVKA